MIYRRVIPGFTWWPIIQPFAYYPDPVANDQKVRVRRWLIAWAFWLVTVPRW